MSMSIAWLHCNIETRATAGLLSMIVAEVERTATLPEDDKRIFEELVEVVQQRDALVALLEEERLK